MRYAALLVSLLSLACATSKQPAAEIDPTTDPTAIAAVAAAAEDATNEHSSGATTGRRIGTAVGIYSAIFGGPESESIDESIARYRLARDAGQVIGGIISGSKRGFAFDQQMAELEKIDELDVTRPAPYVIVAQFADPQTKRLADVARIVNGRTTDIVAAGDDAARVRDALIAHGAAASTLHSVRNDEARGVTLHIYLGGS